MSATDVPAKRCLICREEPPEEEMQELQCQHEFCNMCLQVYPGSLCPLKYCDGSRSPDVTVDECAKTESMAFGVATSTLFRVDRGEKLKCDAMTRNGKHKCVNIATMVLVHCRHNLCVDCLLVRVKFALEERFPPRCAISRCANILSWSEIQAMAVRSNQFERLYELAQKQSIMFNNPCEKRPTDQEVLIECYVYSNENNMKTIVLPKAIVLADAISAVVQLLRIESSKALSSLDVYVRRSVSESAGKYKYEKIPTDAKATIKDAQWVEKTTLVIDPERQIARLRKYN